MSALAYDLRRTTGYIVADSLGRVMGRVESPMYGTKPDEPDAVSVRSGWISRRRRVVPVDTIQQIDRGSGVIGLRVERELLKSFLEGRAPWGGVTRSCRASGGWPRSAAIRGSILPSSFGAGRLGSGFGVTHPGAVVADGRTGRPVAPDWACWWAWRSMAISSHPITSSRPRAIRTGTARLAGVRSGPVW